ncbi:membrane protein involved in the export of O-antigen and teichoic acid [Frankia sp. EI5c]|uniref:lipopolysaccharide biosynthesis protein n=1 Tax=Frankia sp. EI5c TaxID=683316 RepID=UPI0007C22D8A|nr:hypothetical protein [Frankia sp. EI5c]OAA19014.1 membrane protein involved in the export of O-antigen and teichoic acid [Frankia sp. EI5c]
MTVTVRQRRLVRPTRIPATVAVTAGNIALLLIVTANGAIAARSLGAGLRGEFVAAQTWATTAGVVLTFGVTQAIVVDAAPARLLRAPLFAHVALSLVLTVGLFALLAGTGLQPWLTAPGVFGAACLAASAVATSHAAGMAQRRGRMAGSFQLVRIVPALAGAVCTAALVAAGERDPDRWLVTLGVVSLVAALGQLAGSGFGPARGAGARGGPGGLLPPRGFATTARRAYVSVIGAQVIYRLDVLLVAVCLASHQVAFYGVAAAVAGACATVSQSTGMVIFSRLRGAALGDARRIILRGTVLSLAVAAAIALPVGLLAAPAIRIIYGAEFLPAVGATRLLLLASIPLAADYLLIHALLAMNAPGAVTRVQAPVAVLTIVLLVAALRGDGLGAVAAVSVVSYTASAFLLLCAVLRKGSARAVPPASAVPSVAEPAERTFPELGIPQQRVRRPGPGPEAGDGAGVGSEAGLSRTTQSPKETK